MNTFKIHPLVAGLIQVPQAMLTMDRDPECPVWVPMFTWYLEGGDKKIIVDAGMVDGPDFFGIPLEGAGAEGMVNALAQVGLKPEDVDIVILTHLHIDHCANVSLFPHAQFIVQGKEMEFAKNPPENHICSPEAISILENSKLTLAYDGYEVADGIRVLLVPGHTGGSQAIEVNTCDGLYVVTGDAIYTNSNMYPDVKDFTDAKGNKIPCNSIPGKSLLPPGILTSIPEWEKSANRLISTYGKDRLITGHDPSLIGKVLPIQR